MMSTMIKAPLPASEQQRLTALRQLEILDTESEAEFDSLAKVAALICEVPISLISLVDENRQWFKAVNGLAGVTETPRDVAFCSHAILGQQLMEVRDAREDVRFRDNPLVTADPSIRFYAGAPVCLSNGHNIGTLCVIDRQPRQLTAVQKESLLHLAAAAAKALEGRYATSMLARELREKQQRELQFEALTKSAPNGVFFLGRDGQCSYVNAAWEAIYQMDAAAAMGHGWTTRILQEDKGLVFQQWGQALIEKKDFSLEFRIVMPDLSLRYVRSLASAIYNEHGQLVNFVGSVEDISLRKRHEQQISEDQRRIKLATNSGRIGIWELDLETDRLVWDELMYRLYDMPDTGTELSYQDWRARLHPDSLQQAEQEFAQAVIDADEFEGEFTIRWRDGSVHHIKNSAHIQRDARGKAIKLTGTNWDVTKLRALSEELSDQRELLEVTLSSIGDAVITTDDNGQVTWMNPVAERMTGWQSIEARGLPLIQIFHIVNAETRLTTENPVQTCLQQGKIVGLANHTLLISKDGTEFGIEDSASPIRDKQGRVLGVVLVFHDVTESRRLSGEMYHRATHDALTGLVNRAEFESRLLKVLNDAHHTQSSHSLLYIDLDQFKLVNDACGHSAGDLLLQQVSKLIGESIRSRDTLARLGGDEFAIILEQCPQEYANRIAQQICDNMENYRFQHDNRRFRVGTSIGLVPVDQRWQNPGAIMKAADMCCYAAKEAGRNRVHVWFDTDLAIRTRHGEMQWTTRIENALDEARFVLHAQKISAISAGLEKVHAEVLLRMKSEDGNLVMPGAFLPAAERFHLMSRIDKWVVRQSLDRLMQLPDLSILDMLAINLSGQSVGDRAFHRWMEETLTEAGDDICRHLCLEITETAAVTNLADATVFIEKVRSLGVRVALDDFGAGASSFGYLKSIPVDYLKIDGQFVKDIITDPLDFAAVRCFNDVAKVIGVKTIAEFVENREVLAKLQEIGVDYAQGYLIHQPEPLENLLMASPRSLLGFPS